MRQSIRNFLIMVNVLALPAILFYISPVVPMIASAEGIINGSLIVFGIIFLTSLFLGRSFCGWGCGFGGIQDLCSKVNSKPTKGDIFGWIKNIFWIPWWFAIISGFVAVGGVKSINFFFYTDKGFSMTTVEGLIVLYCIYGVIIFLSLIFGKRAYCKYLCISANFNMLGNKIRELIKLPGLRLKANPKACTSCKECNDACIKGLDVNSMVKKNNMYHAECVLCGVCVDTCPKKAIGFSFFK
jgi:ferredoxin-type protein NapH